MEMRELVARFDEKHTYAGEKFLEKYLPGIDSIMDWIFGGIYAIELQFINDPDLDEHDGPSKLEALTALINWTLSVIPMPPTVRVFLQPVLQVSLPILISKAVAFINDLLGNQPGEAHDKSILDLIPVKESTPDGMLKSWVLDVANGMEGDRS